MILKGSSVSITFDIDNNFTLDSTDNRPYDVILNPCNYKRGDFYHALFIVITSSESEISIALIGDCYSSDSDCAVLEKDILTVLQNQTITQINIADGSIVNHIELNGIGCNFGIYKVEKGYVIYGEEEITMLNFNFEKMWSFTGKDIFVSASGKIPFEIKENIIHLYDFENNYYEIDFDGNVVLS
jgi:hypothetical protein